MTTPNSQRIERLWDISFLIMLRKQEFLKLSGLNLFLIKTQTNSNQFLTLNFLNYKALVSLIYS